MDLREKISHRLNLLQDMMKDNEHIDHPDKAYNITMRITPFWNILSEEDREFVQSAQDAIQLGIKVGKH